MADVETTEAAAAGEAGTDAAAGVEEIPKQDPHEHDAGHEEHHPHPSAYVGIAVILAILTAIEVALFYVDDLSDTWNTIALLVLMTLKFALVALWFMHLRFETPLFKRLFVAGIILAVIAYSIVLGASHVFPVLVD